ncbi:C2 domain-containing protein [Dioscorea alata]|uniref:C2 domain-containing protein n=1 Tax=Dioscorea alata TaxID=55571 RepID=A0ACB7W5N1_DIOAL|nr:C2 domain-containing protein [Dioscorea alata]
MRLYVYVLEARDFPAVKASDGVYTKLQVGKHKTRTRTVKNGTDQVAWNEEFVFRLEDENADVELEVNAVGGELLGTVQVPLRLVLDDGAWALPPTWFPLRSNHAGGSKSPAKDCGKILLTISVCGWSNGHKASAPKGFFHNTSVQEQADGVVGASNIHAETDTMGTMDIDRPKFASEQTQIAQTLDSSLVQSFSHKNEENPRASSSNSDPLVPSATFEKALNAMQSEDETEMPDNLQGGILLEQTYIVDSKDLNLYLFGPDSHFKRDLAELEGITDFQEGPWTWTCADRTCLRRTLTYTKASKLVKAVKAREEQTYVKADGRSFAVSTCVVTPDVPCGNCFEVDLLYKIMPGTPLSLGEPSSHLVISWNVNFHQSTLMKGMIESNARQGLKESYEKFADLLAQNIKPVDSAELTLDKEHLLAPLQLDHRSDWELAREYFVNFTLLSFLFMALYVLLHILLSKLGRVGGLEFNGVDLPDSFGELITCGILVLQGVRVYNMMSHFVQARLQRGGDHGVKAQGDGWLLTVALIEGSNLMSVASNELADPYVVFSCNGKTRTSSVQLQTRDPQWNEVLEFDAMPEPPSVLDLEVLDFDGPFGLAVPLGHVEINFLKHTSEELADIWIPLDGKLAQTSQSQLHLRIFLENTKGDETIREYLRKMEKEVGKKINLQSPHKNATFQKIFVLPPEEFLINDFSCYLKRKLPLQGRLFLSARIVAFYANFFGHKTKFFFLWEDIEDIKMMPPSLATVGSPALLFILKIGRGNDARHGSKSRDEEGRLKFQFQSFASFGKASRTIMALWRARTLTFEQQAKLEEDHLFRGDKSPQIENADSASCGEDNKLSKCFQTDVPLQITSLMKIFDGGHIEKKIMEKVGCVGYSAAQWESAGPDSHERHINYKFNHIMSIFGGEVDSMQKRTPTPDGNGWSIEEVMTLHNVPFSEHFHIHLRYQIWTSGSRGCHCKVSVGVLWTKKNKFHKRITKNICDKLCHRSQEIFEVAEDELLSAKAQEHVT